VIIVKERVVAHGPRTKLTEMLWQDKKNYPRKSLFVAKVPQGAEQIL
jgi:hypothetical protein